MPVGNPFLNYEDQEDPYAQWLKPPGVPGDLPGVARQGPIQAAPPVPSRAAAGMGPVPLMRDTPAIPAPPQGLESTPELPRMSRQTISAADPFEGEVERVMDERTKHAGNRPKYNDDQYKRPLWQRLAMAAANGAAGYVNAGGRTRVATIGQDAINARPKYDAAMEDWQRQGDAIDSDLKAILSQDARRRQNQMDANRERRDDAYIELQQAHAKHYLEPPTQRPGAKYLNTSAGVLDTATGQIIPGTEPQQRQRTGNRTPEDVLMDSSASEEEKATAQRLFDAKTRKGGKGAKPQSTRAPQSTFISIENRKNDNMQRAEQDYRKAIAEDPAASESARAELDRRKKQAQIDYEAEIEAAGGSIAPRAASASSGAPKPKPKKNDRKTAYGATYLFDGSQWVKQ